jgi:hypothetical protein
LTLKAQPTYAYSLPSCSPDNPAHPVLAVPLKILTKEDLETLTRIFTKLPKVPVLRLIAWIISSYEIKVMNLIEARLKSYKA